jgi:enoyl-CoA hydratase/carnithine racemase
MTSSKVSEEGPVRVTREEPGLAVITIDRPERKNALNLDIKARVADSVEALSADDSVRVIVLTGANGVFVAGTDIAEMAKMSPTDHTLSVTDRVFTVLRQCRKTLIAAIEGYALGGGCELALACDITIAGESAKIGQPEIRVGIMPGAGGTQRLLRTIGKYRAMKMMLTGEAVTAPEALGMGLLSEVVKDGEALGRAVSMGRSILKMPPLAVRAIKEVVQLGQDAPLETALLLERKAFQLLFDTGDQKEGMNAFLEKRRPVYQGE